MEVHVINTASGVALVVPVRARRAAVPAVLDAETGEEITPAVPAETIAEYDAAIVAGALAGFPVEAAAVHVGTVDAATVAGLLAGNDFDTDDADALVDKGINPRAYRAALEWDGAALVVPPVNKRAAILARLRELRGRALVRSDAEIMKAQEQGNAAALDAWKAYRQALRDLPQVWDGKLASIPAIWPSKPA